MSETKYHFEIEFVPDNPVHIQPDNLLFDGTYTKAVKFSNENHPDYICSHIYFHRCGEVEVEEPERSGA